MILESTAQVSVIRRGAPVDEELPTGVGGAERVPPGAVGSSPEVPGVRTR